MTRKLQKTRNALTVEKTHLNGFQSRLEHSYVYGVLVITDALQRMISLHGYQALKNWIWKIWSSQPRCLLWEETKICLNFLRLTICMRVIFLIRKRLPDITPKLLITTHQNQFIWSRIKTIILMEFYLKKMLVNNKFNRFYLTIICLRKQTMVLMSNQPQLF